MSILTRRAEAGVTAVLEEVCVGPRLAEEEHPTALGTSGFGA